MARMAVIAALVLIALAAVCHADDDPTVSLSGVHDLTPEDFDQYVNGRKHALVELYAPWCGHCKRMTGEFKKLGAKIAGDGKLSSRVVVAKVDADKHRELGTRFDVKGFPTILYFQRGKPVEKHTPYNGARTYEGFLEFIEGQLEADKGFARSASFDSLATKFLGAAEDARAAIVEEAKTAAAAIAGDAKTNADLYARYMQKAVEKGADFFQNEYDRLDRIISGGAASAAKLGEAARKQSVLSAYIPSLNPEPAAAAADTADSTATDSVEAEAEEADGEEEEEFEEFEEGIEEEFAEAEEASEEEAAEAEVLAAEAATEQ